MARKPALSVYETDLVLAACHCCSAGQWAAEERRHNQPCNDDSNTTDPETQKLQTMAARFAPVELTADVAALPENERQALGKLVAAAKVFDALFLRQVWEGNEAMLLDLARDDSPLGRARRHYFLINKGPWSRLDENQPFIPGAPPKPEEANFYPGGADESGSRSLVQDTRRRRADSRHRVLHHDPPRPRRRVHRCARTASSIRARSRTSPSFFEKPRPSPRSPRSRAISRSAPPVF